MRNYECMVIFEPTLDNDAVDSMVDRFSDLIAKNSGKVEDVSKWGKKKFAYRIGQNTEGYYAVFTLQGENQTVNELGRVLKITDGVIRHMIIHPDK